MGIRPTRSTSFPGLPSMTYRLLIPLISCFWVMSAQAQQNETDSPPVTVTVTTNAPSLQNARASNTELPLRGSRQALTFGFDGFQLGALEGGIGGKYWLSPSAAVRGSLLFRVGASESDQDTQQTDGRSSIGLGVSLFAERHSPLASPNGRVSPYLVGGMTFGIEGYSQNSKFPLENEVQKIENDGKAVDFAVLVGLGIEYRVTRRLSFAGEHTFGATVRRATETETVFRTGQPNDVFEINDRDFILGTGTSRLMVSLYF